MDEWSQPDAPEEFPKHDPGSRGGSKKHHTSYNASKKRWNRNNPQKRASYTAKWRKKYPLRYRDYQRRYMAARRALLKARRLEEEAGYGEV